MARSPAKAASENNVTQPDDESLNFDDDTLKGEIMLMRNIRLVSLSLPLGGISSIRGNILYAYLSPYTYACAYAFAYSCACAYACAYACTYVRSSASALLVL